MKSISAVLAISVLLIACSDEKTSEKPNGVIPEHQLKALEKAKDVENQLQQAKDKIDNY